MSATLPPHEAPQSIARLYSDHHGWLVRWLRARLGCSHQAADMAQDTFVRLLLSERKGPPATRLQQPWWSLYRRAIDWGASWGGRVADMVIARI